MKESLRLRGFLADPIEIEQFLQTHPAVALAQVVGVSADRDSDTGEGGDGGDGAVAFVELHPNAAATADELRYYCRQDLANYKVPAIIHLVSEWPTVEGTNGVKIQKVHLRDQARQLLETHAASAR